MQVNRKYKVVRDTRPVTVSDSSLMSVQVVDAMTRDGERQSLKSAGEKE